MSKVTLINVRKVYDKGVVAVKDVNIDVKDKEFIVLVGPSGCGKSTTLRMVAGLEEISSGEIYIGDQLVNNVHPKDRDIAMVFQNYALYPHMTVYENMAFGLKLRKFPKDEIDKRVKEAAEILGITTFLDRKPKALSGGQRQRVAVGRAIVRKPKVFLFDEPLSNLDAKLRVQMRTEISKLHRSLEATMMYVTHDQVEAMTMGDRIVIMKDGIVQQIDTPLNVYHSPANKFVAGFIGSPAMNFIDGKLIQNNGVWFDEGSFKIKLPTEDADRLKNYIGKEIIMGIRPEHISWDIQNSSGEISVKFRLEVMEPMGNELFLYLSSKNNTFVSRIPAHSVPAVGTEIQMLFDSQHLHFFDKDTEKTI